MAGRVRGHVTIEKTGKGIKFQQLLAWATMIFGVGLWIAGASDPAAASGLTETSKNAVFTMAAAGVWLVVLRILRWWHHD